MFTAYEKMSDSLRKMNLSVDDMKQLEKVDWCVTEKIHGANFSFIYEDETLKFAKRKEPLQWSDDFFAFQLIVEKIEHKIWCLFESFRQEVPFDKCTIYGELFGGAYPHKDVKNKSNLQAIQTGVYYTPDIEFCAFDIAIEYKTERYYVDYKKAIQLFETHNLLHAKPLLIGKMQAALNYDITFNSTIPKQLNLPELADNLVEGVVVKPMQNIEVVTKKGSIRPILKIKNERFSEEKKFHQAQKWSFLPKNRSKSEDLSFLLPDLRRYLTKNRLNNVISKIGQGTMENEVWRQTVETAYLQDIFDDFKENNEEFIADLEPTDWGWLEKRLLGDVVEFLKENV